LLVFGPPELAVLIFFIVFHLIAIFGVVAADATLEVLVTEFFCFIT